ncbi:MAG TPA: type VI secretion system amidase effector protein Tae4 [Polyangiaceae bacterium]|nr:type VI secretion system amidase effector protein Tae4 [Polyangiaceae bacterium]
MPSVQFQSLWTNHPSNLGENAPCKDKAGNSAFENQCAIRMGIALQDSGVPLAGYPGAHCWHGHSKIHALRAQELANWLATGAGARRVGAVEKKRRGAHSPINVSDYLGRTGIVFFMNFWGRGNQGDHIDVWDGSDMAHGSSDYFAASEQVWFWAIA